MTSRQARQQRENWAHQQEPVPASPAGTDSVDSAAGYRLLRLSRAIAVAASILVVGATGLGWLGYRTISGGFTQSQALAGTGTSSNGDQNILIMGLDSRLDEKGQPLPSEIYDALHAGDENNGGHNANVLMLVHIPGDGSKATAISIPRDDYTDLEGCGHPCKGKIKEAYDHGYAGRHDQLVAAGIKDGQELEQQSRDAGRTAELVTVSRFLGGIPIDHFIEVTMVAFYQLAEVVQPVSVCVNEYTYDSYSGASFRKGVQEIDAKQAVAFVRQRRDPNEALNFTDLDRSRRQQAFIVSLMHKLQQSQTLTSVSKMTEIYDVVKSNIAIDNNTDITSLIHLAGRLTGGNLSLYTLPVADFKVIGGRDVNIVDLTTIRSIVAHLINPAAEITTTTPPPTSANAPVAAAAGITLNVVNANGTPGLASTVADKWVKRGFTRGTTRNGNNTALTVVHYGSEAQDAARQLAYGVDENVHATADPSLPANTVELILGNDYAEIGPNSLTTPSPAITAVPATGTGSHAPNPTDLSAMDSDNVPCVK